MSNHLRNLFDLTPDSSGTHHWILGTDHMFMSPTKLNTWFKNNTNNVTIVYRAKVQRVQFSPRSLFRQLVG